MRVRNKRSWLELPLALSTVVLGLTAGPYFAWAAWRLRSVWLAAETAVYLALSGAWVVLLNGNPPNHSWRATAGGLLIIVLSLTACIRAVIVWRRVSGYSSLSGRGRQGSRWVDPMTVSGWTPVSSAGMGQRHAGFGPSAAYCDGHDRHRLGMTGRRAVFSGLAGVASIAGDVLLHLPDFGAVGTGIGLVLVAVLSPLFARSIDGPVLYYRTWGRQHSLPLQSVTSVSTKSSKRDQSVWLAAPMLAKPVRIIVRRGTQSPAAYEHLRRWLTSPNVWWSPDAVVLFNRAAQPARRRLGVAAIWVLMLVAGGGLTVWVASERGASLQIPSAPGYTTVTGPDGDALPVGRPWGRACEPIRLVADPDVPGWAYAQIATVTREARAQGIDVTLENRQFTWRPGSLYYRDGQTAASSTQVAIFAEDGTAPTLSDGMPEHINLGWDAALDSDGHNEDLTQVQGRLWLTELVGQPEFVRRSVRQLIAMTQGIGATSDRISGISDTSTTDRFTTNDVAAMLRMSGCKTPTGN